MLDKATQQDEKGPNKQAKDSKTTPFPLLGVQQKPQAKEPRPASVACCRLMRALWLLLQSL